MSEGSRTPDLRWMPETCADEWQRELDSLCALRLMFAGIALRHALRADSMPVNGDLATDIGAAQTVLQVLIDRAAETAGALRDLARVVKAESPPASAKELIH